MKKIALIGNPNCGKTTLFNLLTGARQKVGNWPGVTVEKKFGYCMLEDQQAELVDLPGIYSLEQEYHGVDEQISCDFLANNEAQLIVNLIDASNLERGLVLTQQLNELGVPIIVVLNMLDVAEQHGIAVDPQKLGEQLGLTVVSMVAARKQGIQALKDAMLASGDSGRRAHPCSGPQAMMLPGDADPLLRRYHQSKQLLNGVVEVNPEKHGLSEKLDRVVLNRWLGVPIFLLMIYLMFTFAVNLGAVFIDFFDILFAALLIDGTTGSSNNCRTGTARNIARRGCRWRHYPGRNLHPGDWLSLPLPVLARRFRIYVEGRLRHRPADEQYRLTW